MHPEMRYLKRHYMNANSYPKDVYRVGRLLRPEHISELKDGIYNTCPIHTPKVYMHSRRIQVTGNKCWALSDPAFIFDTHSFFQYNIIFHKG